MDGDAIVAKIVGGAGGREAGNDAEAQQPEGRPAPTSESEGHRHRRGGIIRVEHSKGQRVDIHRCVDPTCTVEMRSN